VGHAHFRGAPNSVRGDDIGFLDDIYIKSDYRKIGIASKLIKKLAIEGKKNKWKVIRWNCGFDNSNAIQFYKKFATKLKWHTFEIKL
jgi:GNAT superfamily N-acetyltransferase|tara:strand:- start:300 stop:560 length:261 start_codon:yes stop_codon:yes gene_type:complete